MQIEIQSDSYITTMEIAKKYAMSINSPVVISLVGDLGAGKTTFSKGFAEGLGVTDLVTSPTFTIMNDYNGRLDLYHFDFYRLGSTEEAYALGFGEYFDLKVLKGVTLVEWASNCPQILPMPHVQITLEKTGEDTRKIIIEVKGWK